MSKPLTIGEASRRTGLPVKTIRFYEDEGLVPPPRRSDSGYRLYSDADLRLLGLVARLRMVGVDLPALRSLVGKALSSNCGAFGEELIAALDAQRLEVERRLAELTALLGDLDALQQHVRHCCEGCDPCEMALDCSYCCVIDEAKGGD